MGMTDPIADLLARIRNAARAGHDTLDIPASKVKVAIAQILRDEGYVDSYETVEAEPRDLIRITLRYDEERTPAIAGMKRVSRPGRRIFKGADDLPKVLGGMGTALISTSAGVMTDRQAARERLGGEVIAFIW